MNVPLSVVASGIPYFTARSRGFSDLSLPNLNLQSPFLLLLILKIPKSFNPRPLRITYLALLKILQDYMEYSKLVAVTGLPGLFELINSKNDGAIIRSLEDGSTRFASSRIHQFSHLESIEVYTIRENVNLVDIFKAMDAAGGSLPDTKDNAKLKAYFDTAYPDLDFERVYASDLKKMVKWFEVLKKKNIELKLSELPEEEEAEEVVEEVEEKPAKKATAKKEKAPKEETEEKPAKKTAAKKEKTEKEPKAEKEAKPAKKAAKKADDAEEKPAKKAAAKKK